MSSSRIEDRTEDFKDALESIGELEQFMMKHRKVTAFIKAYKEQIDLLKNSTTNEEANTKGWHGIKGSDASNADAVAHKHGVVPLPPPSPPRLCSQTEDKPVSACSSGSNTAPVPRNRVIQCVSSAAPGGALAGFISSRLGTKTTPLRLPRRQEMVMRIRSGCAIDLINCLLFLLYRGEESPLQEFRFKVNPFISDKLLCIAYFVSLQMRLRTRPRFKGCRRDLEGWE
ncbi:hypothetical protein Tsubulata_028055 [Turnera subulata]|uniref:Uncharacterized protein n=1 Tax=Turnera subulata TaxID=218843 RepID=A0A9Q0J8B4_9ROSI|nr:hypothetical protein Tsubulata_028055 [Turnera subulata]